ncbi:MAG TPA: flagellar biosynthesis anti-sigma factor FlgM [Rhodocyclaceae bacterium]|nr:flagellar biosynthesis anti-sigma factor FlgM [Rhodocyclaceae bacterium]
MQINNSLKSVGLPGGSTVPARDNPQATNTSTSADTPASAAPIVPKDASSVSPQLQQVQNVLANTPAVNTDRVREIKQAIAEGRFTINPEKIADGLLQNVREQLRDNRAGA